MSMFANSTAKRSLNQNSKSTLDKEHVTISSSLSDESEEVEYYGKTAHILFHYYNSVESGQGVHVPYESVQKAHVGSHKITAGMKQKSIMDFIGTTPGRSPPEGNDNQEGGDSPGEENPSPPSDDVYRSKFSKMNRSELLDTFMRKVDRRYAPEPIKSGSRYVKKSLAEEKCPFCGSRDRVIVPNEGLIQCNSCDTIEYVTLDSERPSYRDPPKELSYFCYKRSNHLKEWISQTQGREYTNIPDAVYDSIMVELKKQKITNLATVTRKKLKEIMKKQGLNKYYEHIPHILHQMSGAPLIRIPPNIEAQFNRMFAQIQVPFMRHAPPDRRNFLSYSCCLHRFADLLGYDEIIPYLPRLKSRQKRAEQNKIWKAICEDLKWEYIPFD